MPWFVKIFFIFLHRYAVTLSDFFPKDSGGKDEILGPFSCGHEAEVLLYRRFPSERPTGPGVVPPLRATAEIPCDSRARRTDLNVPVPSYHQRRLFQTPDRPIRGI